jgi:hypothetical protein
MPPKTATRRLDPTGSACMMRAQMQDDSGDWSLQAAHGEGCLFIGHYGPAFSAKAALAQIPLFVVFFAVQWLDVVWSVLIMADVEHARVVPGLMAGSALDLYDMPYTHSLAGALVLSALLGAAVAFFMRTNGGSVFWIVALCSFSHWILDLLVHRPDLPIYGDVKLGFGLWRWIWISLPLEFVSLFAGAWLYARHVSMQGLGRAVLWIFVAFMASLQVYASFGPDPASAMDEAQTALLAYVALAVLAGIVDLTREWKWPGGAGKTA